MKEGLGKKYWYGFFVHYCPLCGGGNTYKERRYSKRPLKWDDRHHFIESYDYCDEYWYGQWE